jgi:hypothetical protein
VTAEAVARYAAGRGFGSPPHLFLGDLDWPVVLLHIRYFGGPLWITRAAERVLGGMSGSSISERLPYRTR